MSVRWGAATHTGRVRANNQDSYFAAPTIFVVADGMGGHAAGEVASAIAVAEFQTLTDSLAQTELTTDEIVQTIASANHHILEAGDRDGSQAGMGTTLTGLGIGQAGDTPHWIAFNVGDSRVYRYLQGDLRQVTVDHSEVQQLIDAGQITAAEARTHPDRNIVTRSLGTVPGPQPDVWVFPPVVGERFVVCSDGLPRELGPAQIVETLRGEADPERAAVELVDRAVAAGGRDNITVLVVDYHGPCES
jgi:PPM family protein phosphatase